MPFTVEDFQDLLKLLWEHPEWRVPLWAALAGEELLRLPGEFRAFREETDRRFAELAEAQARTEGRVGQLKEGQPEFEDLVVADPAVLHGQPHIRGTRIPVSVILDCLAAGLNEDDILRQYPGLTHEAIRAAIAYAAALVREETVPL